LELLLHNDVSPGRRTQVVQAQWLRLNRCPAKKGEDMKGNPVAFDDRELSDWLISLIENGSENFLGALADAVVTADADDYRILRPALIELKRRYCHPARSWGSAANSSKSRRVSAENRAARSEIR
jgi:hypothetical protein